ncbi:MAG: DUF2997 domain-containing protein [Thermodesulfobacteriota bacterium]
MSEIQEIEVIVSPDGRVKVQVRGVKGPGCLALTGEVEKLLGGCVVERVATDEMDQVSEEAVQEVWRIRGT